MIFLDGILGNADTRRRLGEAISAGTLPHAIMINGARGSGKRTLADAIAMALLCREGGERLPCGRCVVCRRIRAHEHTDVKYLSQRAGKATLGVDEVRIIREDMFLSPSESDLKVYIIENADALTPQSQNALLKVLEEPPRAVYIILIAPSQDKILSTIRSRVQAINMECFGTGDVLTHLKRLTSGHSEERLTLAAQASGGAIGAALENLEDERQSERRALVECTLAFVGALPQRVPFSKLYGALLDFPTARDQLRAALECTLVALRDLIAVRVLGEDAELHFFKSEGDISPALKTVSARRLVSVTDILLGAIADIDKYVITSTLLTEISVRIKKTQ